MRVLRGVDLFLKHDQERSGQQELKKESEKVKR